MNIILETYKYLGNHSEKVTIAIEWDPHETISELLERIALEKEQIEGLSAEVEKFDQIIIKK